MWVRQLSWIALSNAFEPQWTDKGKGVRKLIVLKDYVSAPCQEELLDIIRRYLTILKMVVSVCPDVPEQGHDV